MVNVCILIYYYVECAWSNKIYNTIQYKQKERKWKCLFSIQRLLLSNGSPSWPKRFLFIADWHDDWILRSNLSRIRFGSRKFKFYGTSGSTFLIETYLDIPWVMFLSPRFKWNSKQHKIVLELNLDWNEVI
jgi:hypothetical protein